MIVRKAMASLAAVGLVFAGVAAAPGFAQNDDRDDSGVVLPEDDAGLWLTLGFMASLGVFVILMEEDHGVPDDENPPVSA
jgi:hypothetical protein